MINIGKRNNSRGNSSSDPREEMLRALQSLPFHAFQLAVYLLLHRLGYRQVRFLSRQYLRGRTTGPAGDFVIEWSTPFGATKILVELKQEDRLLQRRYVDELRGKLLSEGLSEGLIITAGRVSRMALFAATAVPSLPIRIVDGGFLSSLMISKGLGTNDDGCISIDREFFRRLLNVKVASSIRRFDG